METRLSQVLGLLCALAGRLGRLVGEDSCRVVQACPFRLFINRHRPNLRDVARELARLDLSVGDLVYSTLPLCRRAGVLICQLFLDFPTESPS